MLDAVAHGLRSAPCRLEAPPQNPLEDGLVQLLRTAHDARLDDAAILEHFERHDDHAFDALALSLAGYLGCEAISATGGISFSGFRA